MSINKMIFLFLIVSFISFNSFILYAQNEITNQDNKNNLFWVIKELNKAIDMDKNKILLDFDNISYYNQKKKIYKKIILKYSLLNDDLSLNNNQFSSTNISNQLFLDEYKRNSRKLVLKNINEFNEANKNLQNLTDFLLSSQSFDGNGLEKGKLRIPFNGQIASVYGTQNKSQFNELVFENGIRIKADLGDDVCSVAKGRIIYADWLYGFGKTVIIDHGKSFYTIYGYFSEILAEKGSLVTEGQVIGKIGDSGTTYGPSLYFEIKEKEKTFDPVEWFKKE